MNKNNVTKTVFFVSIIIVLGKLLGFIREILIGSAFGASQSIDAFLSAESIATIFLGWLTSFSIIFTPVYQEKRLLTGKRDADTFAHCFMVLVFVIGLAGSIFELIGINKIVRLCVPGFSENSQQLTVQYLKIILWTQLLCGIASIFIERLNCCGKKVESSISLLVLGVFQLVGAFCAKRLNNPIMLGYGLLISYITQLMYVFLVSEKSKDKIYFSILDLKETVSSVKMVIPIFVSNMISELNIFFDKFFASFLMEGSIAILHYASRIRILFSYIFSTLVQTVFYPEMSILAYKDNDELSDYVSSVTNVVLTIFLPLTAGCVILSESIIKLIYGRGNFNDYSLKSTSQVFCCYILSIAPLAIRDLYIRVLYSLKKTTVTMYVGIISVSINTFLNWLLINRFSCIGLASATTASAYVSMLIYMLYLNKTVKVNYSFEWIKTIFICMIMGITVYILHNAVPDKISNNTVGLMILFFIDLVIGVGAYFLGGVIIKQKVVLKIFYQIKEKLK